MASTSYPITTVNITDALFNVTDAWNLTNPMNTTTTVRESDKDIKEYTEYQVAFYINKIYMWVIFGVGVPGNLAAILTLVRMKPYNSSTLYMCVLAVFDLLTIVVKISYMKITGIHIQLTDAGCQFFMFMGTFCMHFANWVLVALTVERFVAIWFPFRLFKLCTVRRAIGVLVLIGILLTALNLHFFWSYYEGWSEVLGYMCMIKDEYVAFETPIWYWLDGAVYSIIPTIILVIFNTLIIIGIQKSAKRQRWLINSSDKTKVTDNQKQQRQITTMLVIVSIVFIFLTAPNCLFFIFENRWNYKINHHEYAKYLLAQQTVYMLSDSNHAVNFFLYFLGGQKFRHCFLQSICLCRKRQPSCSHRVASDTRHSGDTHSSSISKTTSVSTISPCQSFDAT